jgi:hypothetical protein
MKVIVFEEDGFVCVTTPAPGCGMTIEEVAQKDVPSLIVFEDSAIDEQGYVVALRQERSRPYLIIDDSQLPDRQFRDRWVIQDGKVVVKDEVENS